MPITVAITAEVTARISVFFSAVIVVLEENSSLYHFRENPVNTEVLFASLKEKNTMTRSGAYRRKYISPIKIFPTDFFTISPSYTIRLSLSLPANFFIRAMLMRIRIIRTSESAAPRL